MGQLLESVYHKCLKHELEYRGIDFISERSVPVYYKGLEIQTDLRCDLLIENKIVIELKAVNQIVPVHIAQLMTYMKLLDVPKGIIYNFNCTNLYKEGQWTYVNELFRKIEE